MFDLEPATRTLGALVATISDDRLDAATPCAGSRIADLLDHVDGLSIGFVNAATKAVPPTGSAGPSADGTRLGTDWRTRIPERLQALAVAWRDEAAWTGMTEAGGVPLPAPVAARVALNEVIVHGWDLAVASGQPFIAEPGLVAFAREFVDAAVQRSPGGTPGLFGPPVRLDAAAPALAQLLALTGRDPGWSADPR